MTGAIVFHLRESHLKQEVVTDVKRPYVALFGHVEALARRHGIPVEYRARQKPQEKVHASDLGEDGNLHIIDEGHGRGPNVLNACLGYVVPYWYLDPMGVRGESSGADTAYELAEVDYNTADKTFRALRQELVHKRRSRYQQPRDAFAAEPGSIAVFFQGFRFDDPNCGRWTNDIGMLSEVLAGTTAEKIYVKLHPRKLKVGQIFDIHDLETDVERVELTDANVHDLLAQVDVAVSHNSAVSFEALLHRKPAITFGRTDVRHHVYPVDAPGQFADRLAQARAASGGYIKYVHWFLTHQYLDLRAPDLDAQLIRRLDLWGFWSRYAQPQAAE